MEAGLVARESHLPFHAIAAAALRGRSPLGMLRNTATLARGTIQARNLLQRERPAAILGTGGYVCVPIFLAARAAGIPTMIYLPDVVPGLAVRLLARLATRVACNVEDAARYFRPAEQRKLVVTGYPVRAELFTQDRAACCAAFGVDAGAPVLLVYGGSRGARNINRAIAALLPHLLPLTQIVHVCGREGDESFLREAANALPEAMQARYRLFPYLFSDAEDASTPTMTRAFGAATVAICRSGASTLAELPAAGLPAILVPLPIPGIHQGENADFLAARGAAVRLNDADMLGSGPLEQAPLLVRLRQLLDGDGERTHMSARSRALARPDAASHLATLLCELAISTESRR